MTKNRKAVLTHSPATGPWFYVGTRACSWGLSASPSKSNPKILPRSPPPGFVSACTLVHAICSPCPTSSTSGARTNAKIHLDLGKYLEGHSWMEHPGLGSQVGPWHSPTTRPMAPDGWHSNESHLQAQPGSALSSTTPFLGRRSWVSEEVRSPSPRRGLLHQAWGCQTLLPPARAAPHNQPSWLLPRGQRGALVWLVSPYTPGMRREFVDSPQEQAAHGADVGREPSAALKWPSERDRGHHPRNAGGLCWEQPTDWATAHCKY